MNPVNADELRDEFGASSLWMFVEGRIEGNIEDWFKCQESIRLVRSTSYL